MNRKYYATQISNFEKSAYRYSVSNKSWWTSVCKMCSPSWWPQVLLGAALGACWGTWPDVQPLATLKLHCLCWVLGCTGDSVSALNWRTLPLLTSSGWLTDFVGCHLLFPYLPRTPSVWTSSRLPSWLFTWGWSLFKGHKARQHN